MEPYQARRVNTRGIIYKDGRLFCQQLKQSHSNVQDPFWCTPGGGIDFGESLEEGLKREMIEETGVEPTIGKLLFVQQFFDGTKEQLEFFFEITNVDDYEAIDLSTTSHGDIEVDRCEFIDPTTEKVLPEFLKKINLTDAFSDTTSTQIFSNLT